VFAERPAQPAVARFESSPASRMLRGSKKF
jgi:hypothetical protein